MYKHFTIQCKTTFTLIQESKSKNAQLLVANPQSQPQFVQLPYTLLLLLSTPFRFRQCYERYH